MSTVQSWYFQREQNKYGPLTSKQLQQAAATGKLLPSDLLWCQGMTGWSPARELKGLTFCAPEPEQDLIDLLPPPDPTLLAVYEASHHAPTLVTNKSRAQAEAKQKQKGFGYIAPSISIASSDCASVTARLKAAAIDLGVLLLLNAFFTGIGTLVSSMATKNPDGGTYVLYIAGGGITFVGIVAQLVYLFRADHSHRQGTPGKAIMDIMVTDLQGYRLSWSRSFLRTFCKLLIIPTFGLSFAVLLFNPRRQALHDLLAGSVVVNRF